MKTPSVAFTLAACVALSLGGLTSIHGQDANPRPRGFGGPGRGPGYDSLSQEEKDKLKAASETAMKDPKVKEAREKAEAAQKEFRDALQAAQVAADPSVEPILKKLQEGRDKAHAAHGDQAPKQ